MSCSLLPAQDPARARAGVSSAFCHHSSVDQDVFNAHRELLGILKSGVVQHPIRVKKDDVRSHARPTLAFNLAGINKLTGIGVTLGFASLAVAALGSARFQRLSFTLGVLAFAACAISYPRVFISWGGFELKRAIIPLVQLVMFGMGTTLACGDFARVVQILRAVLIGFGLQYIVMPLTGWTYATLFGFSGEVAVGLIL